MEKDNKSKNRQFILLLIFLVIAINAFFSFSFFYTNDGAAYLSSARSIFTPDAVIAYEWIREPGYPLFLKFVNEILGRSGNFVIILQLLFLISSILIVAKIYERKISEKNLNFYWLIVCFISIFSPIYFQYSGLVLQQSLFTFLLSIYAWLYFWKKNSYIFYFLTAVLIWVSVNTSILFYYFNFLFILLLATFFYNKTNKSRMNLRMTYLLLFILVIINIISIKPWEYYKEKTLTQNNILFNKDKTNKYQDIIYTDESGNEIKVKLQPPTVLSKNFFYERFSIKAFQNLKILLLSPKNTSENFSFLETSLQDTFKCGGNVANEASIKYREYSQFYFLYSCKSNILRTYIHLPLIDLYFNFYFAIIVLFLALSIKELIWRKIDYFIILLPFLFFLPYYIGLFKVDRYAIPMYPFAISLVAYNVIELKKYLFKK